jgi:electron transfer flavoprotein alpha/beta subunit
VKVVVCLAAGVRGAAPDAPLPADDLQALALATALEGAPTLAAVLAGLVAEEAPLRRALAAGIPRAVRVVGEGFDTADFHTLGQSLATAVKKVGADLVLAPARSVRDGLDATPAALARQLGAVHVACVEGVAAAQTDAGAPAVDVTVRGGGRVRRLRVPLPAVLSVIATGPTPPELPSAGDAAAAIEVISLVDPEATVVRRRTELLGQPELASRPTETVASAKALVAALSRV